MEYDCRESGSQLAADSQMVDDIRFSALAVKNFVFISQFVEIPEDVVFTVEYSVRAAQMAVYELLEIKRPIPPVTPHSHSLAPQFAALVKAFR